MKICETCGEKIAAAARVCPYCESPQSLVSLPAETSIPVRTINLETGLPTVAEALKRLDVRLDQARLEGVRVVRIIHGWGSSSGDGGRIRQAVRHWLQEELAAGHIAGHLAGDAYSPDQAAGRDFLRRHPALRSTENTDRRNPGITFVEL